jgi:predicted ribosomally synthesized peptide with nif11-like leader
MSIESANRFLEAIAGDDTLRKKFAQVQNPEDFLRLTEQLGYCFTADELLLLAKQQSQGITLRRQTGVWKWLRTVQWM